MSYKCNYLKYYLSTYITFSLAANYKRQRHKRVGYFSLDIVHTSKRLICNSGNKEGE